MSGNSVLITTEDVPLLFSLHVRNVYAMPSGEELLVPVNETGDGYVILFGDDGFVPSFGSVRVVLERLE